MGYSKTIDPQIVTYLEAAAKLEPGEHIIVHFNSSVERRRFRYKMYNGIAIWKQTKNPVASTIAMEDKQEKDQFYLTITRGSSIPMEAVIIKKDGSTEKFRVDDRDRERRIKLMYSDGVPAEELREFFAPLSKEEEELINKLS